MAMKLYVSKCHYAPLLTQYGGEGTNFYRCAFCKEPADQVVYPFETEKQMTEWLKKRKAHAGMAYTAHVRLAQPWSENPVRSKSCYRSNMGYLFALITLCLVGILLALAAR